MFVCVHIWAWAFKGQRGQHLCHLLRSLYLIPEHPPSHTTLWQGSDFPVFFFLLFLATCQSACSLWRRSLAILHISHKQNHKYVCLCWLFSNTKPFCACVKYAHACMFTCVSVGTLAPWHESGGQTATLAVWPHLPAGWRPALLLFTAVHTRLLGPCTYKGSVTSTPHLSIGKLGLLNFMQVLGTQTQVLTLVQPLFSHWAASAALTSFT